MTLEILLYKRDDRVIYRSKLDLPDTEVQSCDVSARGARSKLMCGSVHF